MNKMRWREISPGHKDMAHAFVMATNTGSIFYVLQYFVASAFQEEDGYWVTVEKEFGLKEKEQEG